MTCAVTRTRPGTACPSLDRLGGIAILVSERSVELRAITKGLGRGRDR